VVGHGVLLQGGRVVVQGGVVCVEPFFFSFSEAISAESWTWFGTKY
jgi:hypothetical protein